MPESPYTSLLRENGLRQTPGRVALLSYLARHERPLTVGEIASGNTTLDTVTIYRALDAFQKKGIVRRVDAQLPYARFEIVSPKTHHHHAICRVCGKIEDVHVCVPDEVITSAEKKIHGFARLTGHSLEFIGICRDCAPNP